MDPELESPDLEETVDENDAEDEGQENEIDGDEGGEEAHRREENDDGEDEGLEARPTEVRKSEFGRVRAERREFKSQVDVLRRELDELKRGTHNPNVEQQRRETEQREATALDAARNAELSGEVGAVGRYYYERNQREVSSKIGYLEFQQKDNADQVAFERLCVRNPSIASVADEVDQLIASERAQGRPGPLRRTAAEWIIGRRAVERATRNTSQQKKRGAAKIASETVRRTGTARSDVASPAREKSSSSRVKRLENLKL